RSAASATAAGPGPAPGRRQWRGHRPAAAAPGLRSARRHGHLRRSFRVGPPGMKLDLLRHGETELGGGFRGSLDDALTATGWAQMRAGVDGAGPWDVLVSSPLQRCAAFARELEARLGLPLSFDADLRELHFGQWEGRSAAQLMEDHAEGLGLFWNDPYSYTPPDGEPLLDFEARVLAA